MLMYEKLWICRHGASKYTSADDEYNRRRLITFFDHHGVTFKSRPTRRHNKLGFVERKHGTLKNILQRLAQDNTDTPLRILIARATFLSNLFSGSQKLSSFQLVRGYQPSIMGIPATSITPELLMAHMQQTASRALQRVLLSRIPNIPTPGMFAPGDDVWVWYASSKQNEPNEWIKACVVKPHPHYLEARRIKNGRPCKGPTMKPAYEDIRVAPKGRLAQDLMQSTVEEYLGYGSSLDPAENTTNIRETDPRPAVNAMMSQINPIQRMNRTTKKQILAPPQRRSPTDNVGPYSQRLASQDTEIIAELRSQKARILEDMYEHIGSHQVSRHKLSFAPPWILDQAFDKEFRSNWADAFEPTSNKDIPRTANVITSHTVYKIKSDETGQRDMKARIVPHGNRDDEKDTIRKDSSTAQLAVIRLLLSVVTFLGFRLSTADIKWAYLQSGPIQRDISVRPPREWQNHESYKRGMLWKLTKLPYGIVEAGRQWQKTVEDWMLSDGGLERVFGISQLFITRNQAGRIALVIEKVTDDFLIGGKVKDMRMFIKKLQGRFRVGKVVIDSKFHFNGCEIVQDAYGNIRMSMLRYLDRIKLISLYRSRKKSVDQPATDTELKQYRALAGTLLYLGNGVMPQASLVVSLMQQRVSALTVQHLLDANDMTKELIQLKPWVTFIRPRMAAKVTYCSMSDASHPREGYYGQSGIVTGCSRNGLRVCPRKHNPTLQGPSRERV